jgi:hypothetical protein
MIKEKIMYTMVCDNCGIDMCEDQEYSCWSDQDFVKDMAQDSDWITDHEDKDYCNDCWSWDDEDNLILKPIKP